MACAADSKFSNRHVTFKSNLESGHPIRIRIESRSFAGPYLKLRNNYGIGFSVSFGYWLCTGLGLVFRVIDTQWQIKICLFTMCVVNHTRLDPGFYQISLHHVECLSACVRRGG